MILADKIINERKKNGWSQEELAEKLSVSRQSVSKWEGAQAVPDLQKILKMAEVFGVTTDYLLKDEMESELPQAQNMREEVLTDSPRRRVSMEEAVSFLNVKKQNAPWVASGVTLCIFAAVPLILLSTLAEYQKIALTESAAEGIGLGILLLLVSLAVGLFIMSGQKSAHYEYLEKETFETEYGVVGMVKERKKAFESKYTLSLILGVTLCVLAILPVVFADSMEMGDMAETISVCVMLSVVAVAVYFLVHSGIVQESFKKLLQENDYTEKNKKVSKVIGRIASVYWSLVMLGFFFIIFYILPRNWSRNYNLMGFYFIATGILFGVIACVVKMIMKADE